MNQENGASGTAWFVGASYGGSDDQTARFLSQGIWENGYDDRYLDLVRSMRPGDRIAIKAAYTRRHELPFENHGHTVSVMGIKAVGTITDNPLDGKRVQVDWERAGPTREWYFYTHRGTIWRVPVGEWKNDALIAFAFDQHPQDLERFCNEPMWRERFGYTNAEASRFAWTAFYEAVAEKLLAYAQDRRPLVAAIHEIATRTAGLGYLQDRFVDGTVGPLRDICPFTVMGTFNRTMTGSNRSAIAAALGQWLGVNVPAPSSFEGVPVLNNQRSWFFAFEDRRGDQDIDALWKVFVSASRLADDDTAGHREDFVRCYDEATQVWGVAWNLSTGLYWSHPWHFATLDSQSRRYIDRRLDLKIIPAGPQRPCNGHHYLRLLDDLRTRFEEEDYPVHDFPGLSQASWMYKDPSDADADADADAEDALPTHAPTAGEPPADEPPAGAQVVTTQERMVPYTVDDILADGCFLARQEVDLLIERLRTRKNLILQGPPGTGKTWLAKRLAYALMGQKDDSRVRAVQFHPNLSYEDFVRGLRPGADGRFVPTDGVFMEAVRAASSRPNDACVVVIEEINRGNPAQIFGELLTLLEAGKRTPSEALELCYPDADGRKRPVHIPDNLYVVGTMNIADRSLALVDFALRRRFAFVTLEPRFGLAWRNWVAERGVDAQRAADIEQRIATLNRKIEGDRRLGKPYCLGHSYVTPSKRLAQDTKVWFEQVVLTEIGPLLDEYWFDAPDQARAAIDELLHAW